MCGSALKNNGNANLLPVRSSMRAPPLSTPNFESLAAPAAPLVTGLDTLLPSRLEDKATLESDLSAAPEAEMGWGLEKVPGLPIGVS